MAVKGVVPGQGEELVLDLGHITASESGLGAAWAWVKMAMMQVRRVGRDMLAVWRLDEMETRSILQRS